MSNEERLLYLNGLDATTGAPLGGPVSYEALSQRVLDEYGPRGFVVLGVSANQEGPEFVDAFVKDLGVFYPTFVGAQPLLGHLTSRVRGLPTSFLVGRDGKVVTRVEGVFPEDDLRAAVERLLEGGGRPPSHR